MNELKELCWVCLFTVICGPIVLYAIGYLFAKITYRRAHKTRKTIQKVKNYKQFDAILFNIDSKNKTLQEIKAERNQMKRILGGI